ncbi:MAG: hypothetical protein IJM30_08820 [Thermoguttaceae bacterium]|nr:hypothetical protein [Thermoguttaceae bacterium]
MTSSSPSFRTLGALVAVALAILAALSSSSALASEESSRRANSDSESRVYLLAVFGEPDSGDDLRKQCALVNKKKIEVLVDALKKKLDDRLEVVVLSGAEASPASVRNALVKIGAKSGADDAILVYFFVLQADVPTEGGAIINAIAPLAPSSLELDYYQYGIARQEIRRFMAAKPRRLEILLVDVCPTFVVACPYATLEARFEELRSEKSDFAYLARFLAEGEGALDLSSAKGNGETEANRPIAWIPLEAQNEESRKKFASEKPFARDKFSGTVFLNALLDVAESGEFTERDLIPSAFRTRLAEALSDRVDAFGEAFLAKRSQSLARFGERGFEIRVEAPESSAKTEESSER